MPDPKPTDLESLTVFVRLHHDMITLGQIARGFPDLPQILPEDYTLPPEAVFQQMVEAVLVTLDAMSNYKIIRDAVCRFVQFWRTFIDHVFLGSLVFRQNYWPCRVGDHTVYPPINVESIASFGTT
jgi:hypothetical protein